ncbi:PDZ domain-containing protein [Actinomyces sp. 186855]|nr:PDZ domain-containing protein [Actinomyces sp. AC-20-1]MCL3790627.1 PDZ domain-containing protein [Actinomyces sp. 187325]MCL3792881.1 PDZ domain-containing protein [Actinomyces sp. 186855]MCL3795363.1 PDZ domain-containing protein [Actinomyces sp. 217892]
MGREHAGAGTLVRVVPSRVPHDGAVTDLPTPDCPDGPHGPDSPTSPDGPSRSALPPATGAGSRRHRLRRALRVTLPVLLAVTALVAAATVPVGYVIESPGPTWNVLGAVDQAGSGQGDGAQVITVTGAQTYPAEGALRMTTVAVRGCPGHRVTLLDVLGAWLDADESVIDRDLVCPATMSAEEVEEATQSQMLSSQSTAVVAALLEAGLAGAVILEVQGLADAQSGAGLVAGDVLTALTVDGERTEITDYPQLRRLMTTLSPGTRVTVTVERDGTPTDVALTTLSPQEVGAPEDMEGSVLGITLVMRVDSEVDAQFGLESVGGPSAGSMFALGIIDALTPGSLTGGQDVAGTGTISMDGSIGAIGGIRQKMVGAAQAGSSWFLAPVGNCSEVVGHEPEGMTVVAVSSLHEAVEAVEAIASGRTSSLPSCQAAGG